MGKDKNFEGQPMKRSAHAITYLTVLLLPLLMGCVRVPDHQLEERFRQHTGEFEQLVAKANHDREVRSVSATVVQPEDVHVSTDDWKRYQDLFRTLNIREGMTRDESDSSTIFFIVYGHGGAVAGDAKGYVYSVNQLATTQADLDSLPEGTAYKQIAPHWYIFRHSW